MDSVLIYIYIILIPEIAANQLTPLIVEPDEEDA